MSQKSYLIDVNLFSRWNGENESSEDELHDRSDIKLLDDEESDTRSITSGNLFDNEETEDKDELETDEDDCEGK